jgi:hypothetical protein
MGKVKFTQTMSLDGYTAGPEQTQEEPLGKDGESLHEWVFSTRTFREMFGREGGDTLAPSSRFRLPVNDLRGSVVARASCPMT